MTSTIYKPLYTKISTICIFLGLSNMHSHDVSWETWENDINKIDLILRTVFVTTQRTQTKVSHNKFYLFFYTHILAMTKKTEL